MTIQPVISSKKHGCALSRACAAAIMTAAVALVCGCGTAQAPAAQAPAAQAPAAATPKSSRAVSPAPTRTPGVMLASQACKLITEEGRQGFFTHIEQVHLVLTSYSKGEPIESAGDISAGMASSALVWVVDVHAQAINWGHSEPAVISGTPAAQAPDTDYSVVMDARTGDVSDARECNCWPLPLGRAGTLISLPASC